MHKKNFPFIYFVLKAICICLTTSRHHLIIVGYRCSDYFLLRRGWKIKAFTYDGFNLNVEDGNIWIGSLGSLVNFKISQFKNPTLDSLSYQTLDGQTLYKGFRIRLEKGKYRVAISGYKKRVTTDSTIYGYGFNFELTNEFTSYKDPREDEQYTFNMIL